MDALKTIATNRRARHEFHILETIEAGIELRGTEVKSVREGRVNLRDSYAEVAEGELFLVNLHISPYEPASHFGHDPDRRRKLLIHRGQLERLSVKLLERGLALVPLAIYFKGPWAKVELGLGRGKKTYDRRQDLAERESRREMARALGRRRKETGGDE
jgi:SsrA-binding protein